MVVEKESKRVAQHLPCTISHRGPVNAAYLALDGEDGLRSLRGRKLERGVFEVPDTHQLLAVEQGEVEGEEGALKIKFKLENKGVFYNHDDPADEESAVPKAVKWFQIASALHAPIDPDTLEQSATAPTDQDKVEQSATKASE